MSGTGILPVKNEIIGRMPIPPRPPVVFENSLRRGRRRYIQIYSGTT
jgi:hypothetical protein